ncbi:hypothetical protein EDB84DRAFT_1507601, partial [Lactarius hengduanensis]
MRRGVVVVVGVVVTVTATASIIAGNFILVRVVCVPAAAGSSWLPQLENSCDTLLSNRGGRHGQGLGVACGRLGLVVGSPGCGLHRRAASGYVVIEVGTRIQQLRHRGWRCTQRRRSATFECIPVCAA